MGAPEDLREWVSFEDPHEQRTWLFDLTLLTSRYRCIWGQGCRGLGAPAQAAHTRGCCLDGPYLADEEDAERVTEHVAGLQPEHWELMSLATRRGGPMYRDPSGRWRLRRHKSGCILLNREGFLGGVGCALHVAALDRGRDPRAYKPEVCSELPLRRVDYDDGPGWVLSVIGEWRRRDWAARPGSDEGWWCTEVREAFCGQQPLYRTMQPELVSMVGEDAYLLLVEHIKARGSRQVAPHPAAPPPAPPSSLRRSSRRRRR